MIRFLGNRYTKRQIRFLFSILATTVQDLQDECKYRKRNCTLCEYNEVCKDLDRFNHYLEKKSFEN